MSKIEDFNYIYHQDSLVKKKELKNNQKTTKSSKTSFGTKNIFGELFENEEIETDLSGFDEEEISRLLKDIGRQGLILKKSRDLNDLENYKNLIKKYLKGIIDISETTERKTVYDAKKKEKITKIYLQITNKELLELTRVFLSEQYDVLKVASQIDRIEGLLIDLKM